MVAGLISTPMISRRVRDAIKRCASTAFGRAKKRGQGLRIDVYRPKRTGMLPASVVGSGEAGRFWTGPRKATIR